MSYDLRTEHLNARISRLDAAQFSAAKKSYRGIAARLDRFPVGPWHQRILVLFGGAIFCACLDMYVGGGILAQLYQSGWSTVDQNALFSSVTMAGYLLGGLLAGFLADRYGRRFALIASTLIFALATLLAATSINMEMLIAFRGLMGVGLGGALPCCYCSMGEYTPPLSRGRYASWVGVIGNFSPPFGALLTVVVIPIFGWQPIFIGIALVSFFACFLVWRYLPESPRWLAAVGRTDEADEIVTRTELEFARRGIELPAIDINTLAHASSKAPAKKVSWRVLFSKELLGRTVVSSAALFAMNLAVYTITTWTPTMFVMRGLDSTLSISIVVVMLIGAPFGIFLLGLFADKHNRKTGLVVSLILLAILSYFWALIPADEIIAIMIVGFVVCSILYYYSLLACSVYLGELFPTEVRLRGAGFAHAIGRIAGIVSPYYIAFLLQSLGMSAVFLVNGIALVFLAIVIGAFGCETRRKSLEEINEGCLPEQRI